MPRRLEWRDVGAALTASDADIALEKLRSYDTSKSHLMPCTVCGNFATHKMRYKRLTCASTRCKEAVPSPCPWKGKVLICLETERTNIYEVGEHYAAIGSPKRAKLTQRQKSFCRELAAERLRPQRIRHALARRFSTPLTSLPSLQTIQNFVNYYARTKLKNHDQVKEFQAWIHARAFDGTEADCDPFTFSWDNDSSGRPMVGNGADTEPFFVGISTKALIRRLTEPPQNYIFHLDATFEMNAKDFPVLVVGISDSNRSFHLVALFMISQRLQWIYEGALSAIKRLYACITEQQLDLRYVMGDAEDGQCNAVWSVFGSSPGFKFLMCYFHVLQNVNKKLKAFPSYAQAALLQNLCDLHFATSESEFLTMRDAILCNWRRFPSLSEFTQYMKSQWLYGAFSVWQAFATPSGFATTNNPVEQFNRVLKRDYTMNRRLKVGMLLCELSNCCVNESTSMKPFHRVIEAQPALVRRAAELTRAGLLVQGAPPSFFIDTATGITRYTTINVVSSPAPRVRLPELGKTVEAIQISAQMGVNFARMEHQNQPWGGWPVDMVTLQCPCKYSFRFGTCIHKLYAIRISQQSECDGELVNRRVNRKRKNDGTSTSRGGRPPSIGPALSLD